MQKRVSEWILFICLCSLVFIPVAMAAGQTVNINTATVKELCTLQGIGKKYAERIVEYRQKNGPFKQSEEITKVKGIGQKIWEKNKDRLAVSMTPKKE